MPRLGKKGRREFTGPSTLSYYLLKVKRQGFIRKDSENHLIGMFLDHEEEILSYEEVLRKRCIVIHTPVLSRSAKEDQLPQDFPLGLSYAGTRR